MIPSLAHLSALATPRYTKLTGRQDVVLRNIKWDCLAKFDVAMARGCEIEKEFAELLRTYNNAIKHGDKHSRAFLPDVVNELSTLYDETMEYRNEMHHENLWSKNYVYLDWVCSRVLCCPHHGMYIEELIHMLSGCTSTWLRMSPVLNLDTYTQSERVLAGFIVDFKSAAFRIFDVLNNNPPMEIDKLQELASPLIALNEQLEEIDHEKMFLKKLGFHLEHHVSEFTYDNFRDDSDVEDGEIILELDNPFDYSGH